MTKCADMKPRWCPYASRLSDVSDKQITKEVGKHLFLEQIAFTFKFSTSKSIYIKKN